jgi:hypothetical protein
MARELLAPTLSSRRPDRRDDFTVSTVQMDIAVADLTAVCEDDLASLPKLDIPTFTLAKSWSVEAEQVPCGSLRARLSQAQLRHVDTDLHARLVRASRRFLLLDHDSHKCFWLRCF